MNSRALYRAVTGVPFKWARICEQASDAIGSPLAELFVDVPHPGVWKDSVLRLQVDFNEPLMTSHPSRGIDSALG